MRLLRLKNPIFNEMIEVAANACWGQAKALSNDNCRRRAIFEDRTSDRITGTELVDFHNTIVT
jgi:hypothetical protein